MKCFYYIHLPGGKESIKIPADFGKINLTDELTTQINNVLLSSLDKEILKKGNINDEKLTDEQRSELVMLNTVIDNLYKASEKSINKSKIKTLLLQSNTSLTPELLVEQINSSIEENSSYDSLEKALSAYLKGKSINELNATLRQFSGKVNINYFNGLDYNEIVGKTSLQDEIDNIDLQRNIAEVNGESTIILTNVMDALENLSSSSDKDITNLIKLNSLNNKSYGTFIIGDPKNLDNPDNFLFYKEGDWLSLFLVKFKQSAYKLLNDDDINDIILPVIELYNESLSPKEQSYKIDFKDLKSFLLGSVTNKGKFVDGEFYKLFNTIKGREVINTLINVISDKLVKGKSNIVKSNTLFKKIFSYLNPEIYGKSVLDKEEKELEDISKKNKQNSDDYIRITSEKYAKLTLPSTINENYGLSNQIENTDSVLDTFDFINKNISIGVDLLKLPKSKDFEYGRWIIPTEITLGKNNQLQINGVTWNQSINRLEKHFSIVKEDELDQLKYRKLENTKISDTRIPSQESNNIWIKSENPDEKMDKHFIKSMLGVGSYVNFSFNNSKGKKISYHGIVTAVYPGIVKIDAISKDGSKKHTVYTLQNDADFNNIESFTSPYLSENIYSDSEISSMWEWLSKYKTYNNSSLVSSGSIISYEYKGKLRFNKVLSVNNNQVYILVESEKGVHVRGINKNLIKSVKVMQENTWTEDERASIEDFISNHITNNEVNGSSLKDSNYSIFTNYNVSENGDYIVDNKGIYWKILDKKSYKVQDYLGKVKIINVQDIKHIITEREIGSDKYAMNCIEVNSLKINKTKKQEESNVIYLIDKDTDTSDLRLLSNDYLQKGEIVNKEYFDKKLSEAEGNIENSIFKDYKNITNEYLNLYKEKYSAYPKMIIKEGTNIYQKNEDSLLYQDWDYDTKLQYIQNGAYIKFKGINHLYRVMSVFEENGTKYGYVEYNKLNMNGKLVTVNTKVNLTEKLLDSETKLWFIKGNNTIKTINSEKKLNDIDNKKPKKFKEIPLEKFVFKMQKIFGDINVPIRIDYSGKEFNNTNNRIEKAKIQNGEIIINGKAATEEDVIHEYLHLFMINAKYKNPELYQTILIEYGKNANINDMSLDKLEESLVEYISDNIYTNGIDNISDSDSFLNLLKNNLVELNMDEKMIDSLDTIDILLTPVSELVKDLKKTNKLFNQSILLVEPAFREWIKNNNIKQNCN